MTKGDLSTRDSFGSKFGVLAATAGSAIGLGNIWRFPYIAGENGGGAFLVVYLLFILAIGIPVMMSEFVIGRRAQRNPYGAFKKLAPGKPWFLVGIMGVIAAFVILIFYNTVAGWTLEYIYQSVTNAFEGKTSDELTTMFEGFREGSVRPLLWMVVFMALTAWIVLAGVQKGIEKYTKVLMPILLVLIIILDIRALTLPGGSEGLSFLFKPDFSKINSKTVLEALGQAFFSLSIGMGTLITYGSYMRKRDNLANTALNVSLADTFVAILAGIAIFPAVFAFGFDPASEEGLVFIVLPKIFQEMPGGFIFSILFFILLAVAALTSTISILEVVVAYFVEELKMVRKKATIVAAVSISAVGIFAAASWGWASDLTLFGLNIFQLTNFAAVNILLPVGGLFIVIFIGWFLKTRIAGDELSNSGSLRVRYLHGFIFIVKFIAPIAIALVFLYKLGIFGN